MADERWQRLADRVKSRRYDMHLTQTMLAREARTSDRTIGALERAEHGTYQASTLRSISIALGWTPDSIDRVLAGEQPVEATDNAAAPDLAAQVAILQRELAELRRVVEALTKTA